MVTQSETPDISELVGPRKVGKLEVQPVAERDPYLTMLIYGLPGAGKTVLAGSASAVEEMAPVLLIDVEGGTFSLRSRYPDVDVVRTTTWQQMQEVYNELYRGSLPYKTVILDSLTEIQRLSMLGIMAEVVKKEPDRDAEIPSIREWGKNGEQTRRMVRAFRDLKMNTIFTALVLDEKDQKSGKMKYRPSLSGKMANEVSGYVDVCAYLYTSVKDDKVCRFLLTGSIDTHVAKDRSDRLPLVLEEPSMTKIHDIIFNEGDTQQ
jgi:phage nucleotide-binding protein